MYYKIGVGVTPTYHKGMKDILIKL